MRLLIATLTGVLFYTSVNSLSIASQPCVRSETCRPTYIKTYCIKCPGAGPNDPGYCSELNPTWETDFCFNLGYAQFCSTACYDRHSVGNVRTQPPAQTRPTARPEVQPVPRPNITGPASQPEDQPVSEPAPQPGDQLLPGPTTPGPALQPEEQPVPGATTPGPTTQPGNQPVPESTSPRPGPTDGRTVSEETIPPSISTPQGEYQIEDSQVPQQGLSIQPYGGARPPVQRPATTPRILTASANIGQIGPYPEDNSPNPDTSVVQPLFYLPFTS